VVLDVGYDASRIARLLATCRCGSSAVFDQTA
jgi:hypothetical protein